MERLQSFLLTLALAIVTVQAQIGYQVAIMDQTSGKPKANENVSVSVTISDNVGTVICSETHDVTTNDVGIATLQIGNANTFANADWTNLPLWVSATVGGTTIAKSQILNVPVAECSKQVVPLDIEKVKGRWNALYTHTDEWLQIKDSTILLGGEDWYEVYYIDFIYDNVIGAHYQNETYPIIIFFNQSFNRAIMLGDRERTFVK